MRVDGEVVGEIGPGWSILLGVGPDDTEAIADDLARKTAELRIFRDEDGRTNRSLLDIGGSALVVSQFTLYADTRRGRRPGFTARRRPELAERLYLRFAAALRGARRRRSRRAGSAPRWRSSSSTTARSRSGSTPPSGRRDAGDTADDGDEVGRARQRLGGGRLGDAATAASRSSRSPGRG